MKGYLRVLICLMLISAFAGCRSAGTQGITGNQSSGVRDVLEQSLTEADSGNPENIGLPAESSRSDSLKNKGYEDLIMPESSLDPAQATTEPSGAVDVDLTVLSSTMVYAEVYQIMVSPEEYIGKTIKMEGSFAYYHDNATGNNYFACIIADATGCCAQGIEFVLTDDYAYPDDYPKVNAKICVVGTFDTYQEGDNTYYTLKNATLV